MQFKTKMQLNARTEVEMTVEAKDLEEAVTKSSVFLDFTGSCGLCNESDVTLKVMRSGDGKYSYTKYVCNVCGASQTFGKRQADGGLFLKQWEPKYQGDNQ